MLEAVESAGVDRILHAGDVVGYNPFPNEVVALLQRHRIASVRGNHDRAALTGDTSWFNPVAAQAATWTREQLSAASREYLASLPPRLEVDDPGGRVTVVHGSPRDEDEYIYPQQATPGLLEAAGCDVLVMGHTHVPYTLRIPKGLLVNAGSVGQPRDGDPQAAWVHLDTMTLEAQIERVPYDVGVVREEVTRQGLPEFLGERLAVGR